MGISESPEEFFVPAPENLEWLEALVPPPVIATFKEIAESRHTTVREVVKDILYRQAAILLIDAHKDELGLK